MTDNVNGYCHRSYTWTDSWPIFEKNKKIFDHKSVLGVFGLVEYDAAKIIIT